MPSSTQHLDKARSNLNFAQFVARSSRGFIDWVITAYFYAALHYIEAYFDLFHQVHYRKHAYRSRAISNDPRLSPIYNDYRRLQTYSETARYGIKQFDDTYVSRRILPHFTRLRASIEVIDPSLRIA